MPSQARASPALCINHTFYCRSWTMADSNPVDSPEPPQPTDKSSDEVTYNWTDITKEFFAASADLKLGELLHDEKWVLIQRDCLPLYCGVPGSPCLRSKTGLIMLAWILNFFSGIHLDKVLCMPCVSSRPRAQAVLRRARLAGVRQY